MGGDWHYITYPVILQCSINLLINNLELLVLGLIRVLFSSSYLVMNIKVKDVLFTAININITTKICE